MNGYVETAPLVGWSIVCWYMLGALLRVLHKLLGWFREVPRATTFVQEIACAGQSLILTAVCAFLWTGSHIWALIEATGFELPIGEVGITPLTSIAGFFIEWLLVDRVFHWFKSRRRSGD